MMTPPTMSDKPKIKIVKRDDDKAEYVRRHEQSLLELLIERHFERAKLIIQRLSESGPRKAA
jgi:hypothetical protein